MADPKDDLLGPDEPQPADVINSAGRAPFLLLGDHAGTLIPRRLGSLGLPPEERARHIAVDIGVRGLGERLAERLDAPFLHQRYSRLVVDCNRDPASPEAIPEVSDGTVIPGNQRLGARDREQRVGAIHRPYHDRIASEIAARPRAMLISLHSFTPVFGGYARPWYVGVLHWEGDTRFARALLDVLGEGPGRVVGDNEPYRMDATDYTVPRHAFAAGLPYAEIEVRQDLIADADGQAAWAEILAEAFGRALLLHPSP
ncbi:N-formylglutamate amidohydrolase [Flavisphingomonas formosensis]|uniref:N-formylglutamate amidohydrolase n=1 Tax=Flavisphingomonas formosensis TaxID=861534 RepID=UPI0012F71D77|nr:N-formylglutamate amidohydrolase [Sphingomonas formosensis]